MAETPIVELIERHEVDPPAEPDERGWIAVTAYQAIYRTTTLVDDVDGAPLAVTTEHGTVESVTWVPPDSTRLARLAFERAHPTTDPEEGTDQ